MTSVVNTKFAVKPVAAALALALSASVAIAAPTPNQMPGAGRITNVSTGSTTAVGNLVNLVSGATIPVDGKVVIRWGDALAIPTEVLNPYGFNLGANAVLNYSATTVNSAVLNIDVSGNPSQIFGQLVSNVSSGFAPALFVSNANGIVVGEGGSIVAPTGVGLIGANLDNPLSIGDFTGNNGWVAPAAQVYGNSYISFGSTPVSGNVTISGSINGDAVKNLPAQYILIAGNNVSVLETGNVFGTDVSIDAGIVATGSKQAVNGIAGQLVNRLWNVDSGQEQAYGSVGPLAGDLSLSSTGTGNFVNIGSISAKGTSSSEVIVIQAKGNVRTGIAGNNDTLVGLYSDQGVYIDAYSDKSSVEIYNVVTGYTTNKTLPFLYVNSYSTNHASTGVRSDVTAVFPTVLVNALKPGAQPSTITTTDNVQIYGGDVTIASTINHKLDSAGGAQNDADLIIWAKNKLTVSADIGAGGNVDLTSGGALLISGNVLSDTDELSNGGIYIQNTGAGATSTISGNLTTASGSNDDIAVLTAGPTTITGIMDTTAGSGSISVTNAGVGAGNSTKIVGNVFSADAVLITQLVSPVAAPVTVAGDIVADGAVVITNASLALGDTTKVTGDVTSNFSSVLISNLGGLTGDLLVSGVVAGNTVSFLSSGTATIGEVDAGAITATVNGLSLVVNGPWTAATSASITSPIAVTKFTPEGTVEAFSINLDGLDFLGVKTDLSQYTALTDKPDAQFITNDLNVHLKGSIAGRIAGTNNWVSNSFDVAPLIDLAPVFVSATADGGGFQSVNIRVKGDAYFDTGATTTPFIGVPTTTGGFPAGGLQGNLGSQLIIAADGALTITGTSTGSLFGPSSAAQWPGGASFIAGTTLQLMTPFYNAWTTQSPAFGGVFFTAPTIALGGYIATSGTAWANFSSKPVTGDPTVYQIRQLGTNAFGFEATEFFVKNDYVLTVAGGPICSILGPTTWVACP